MFVYKMARGKKVMVNIDWLLLQGSMPSMGCKTNYVRPASSPSGPLVAFLLIDSSKVLDLKLNSPLKGCTAFCYFDIFTIRLKVLLFITEQLFAVECRLFNSSEITVLASHSHCFEIQEHKSFLYFVFQKLWVWLFFKDIRSRAVFVLGPYFPYVCSTLMYD